MDCVDRCPKGIVGFRFRWDTWRRSSERRPRPVDLSRRGLLVGIAAGVGIPGVAAAVRLARPTPVDPFLLRPPGAADEKKFLALASAAASA